MPNARRPLEIAHFVIRTREVAPLVEFYKVMFDATVVHDSKVISFLTYDHEHHRFAIALDPAAADSDPAATASPKIGGYDHVAFTTGSLGDLLHAYKTRKEAGISPAYCFDHGMSVSMYYTDPDGNKLEVQADAFEDPADAARFMASDAFAANPRGVHFDPDALLERLERGETEAQMLNGMRGRTTVSGLTA